MSDAEWSYASALIELEEEATEGPGALGSPAVGSEIGPFAVEANLGRGAMGEVFQVRYRGRSFALKLLANEDPRQRERLAREAQLVGALDHPGIVRLHGAGSVDDRTFLLYALVPAARRLSEAWAGLELTERVELIAAVAEAVGHAHAQGVVHRDLKPENVLVDGAGRPWVIDFGLATHADLGRLTQSGALLGTPSYMAPEQFAVEGALQRPPVDVWSLGVLLYEALTGTLPFPATTVLELSVLLQRCAPRPPRALVPEVPRAVEAVCLRALRLAQDERPPDGQAFARALRAALDGAVPASAARTRGRRVGALLGALLAGGLLLGGWLSQQRTPGLDPSPAAERDPLDQPFRLLNDEGLDPAELLARARERLATDPLDLAARVAEAAALQGLDDYDAAAALAESVLEERPEHLGALQVLAGCSYRLGRHPQATAACERALGVDPRSEFALVYLSLLASARGEPAAGVDFAERALAAHAQSGGAYGARGVARMNLGQVADALADFDASLKTGEVQDIRFNHACALMHLGREAEAIEDLERVQGPLRDSVEWRATRIQCLLELDPQQAEREARALVAERSERPDATYLLADALRRQGEPEAKSWFQRVIELDSASQWGRAAARKLSGAR